jgi:hypothetical protein
MYTPNASSYIHLPPHPGRRALTRITDRGNPQLGRRLDRPPSNVRLDLVPAPC